MTGRGAVPSRSRPRPIEFRGQRAAQCSIVHLYGSPSSRFVQLTSVSGILDSRVPIHSESGVRGLREDDLWSPRAVTDLRDAQEANIGRRQLLVWHEQANANARIKRVQGFMASLRSCL